MECCQRYLLESPQDADCMSCHAPWNREFLYLHFSKAFVNRDYKGHREQVLFEREKALLPASQHMVENWNRAVFLRERYPAMSKEYYELQAKVEAMKRKRSDALAEMRFLEGTNYQRAMRPRNGEDEASDDPQRRSFIRACPAENCRGFLSSSWKCGTCSVWVCPECHVIKAGGREDAEHVCNPDDVATARLLRRDTRPCPTCAVPITKIEGCFKPDTPILMYNGTLKTARDVVVGDVLVGDDGTPRTVLTTCSGDDAMYEIVQTKGCTYTVNSQHKLVLKRQKTEYEICVDEFIKLDPTVRQNFVGINSSGRETCIMVVPVGRGPYVGWSIDGNKRFILPDFTVVRNCDQMFCVQCHTAFSWRTGVVVTNGIIHNPHYYEWQRRINGGVAPRVPGDQPCGGLPTLYVLSSVFHTIDHQKRQKLETYHRIVNHVRHVDMAIIRNQEHGDNADLRLRYLTNQIDEKEWKQRLQQREKRRLKNTAVELILEMFVTLGTDMFRDLASDASTVEMVLFRMNDLVKYSNENIDVLEKRFSMKIDHIPVG